MIISQAVKRFIRLETKEQYKKENFDEVYYILKRIIEYDIEVPGITGLSERLPYALNRIAEDGLTRQDIMTFFPIVWQKFEPYVKKILYIIDSEGFELYANCNTKTLPDYLKRLNVSYSFKVPVYKRNAFSHAFCEILDLRNTEAHDCEYWSITMCYEKLSQTLLAYLFLTDHCLDEIKRAIKTGNLHVMIPIYTGTRMEITCPSFINVFKWIRENPGTDFHRLKRVVDEKRDCFFTYEGNLQSCSFNLETGNSISTYEWREKNKNELLQFEQTREKQILKCKCIINDDGEVSSYIVYRLKYDRDRKTEIELPHEEWKVSHLPNGGVDLLHFQCRDEWREVDGTSHRRTNNTLVERIRFNSYGLISCVDSPYEKQPSVFVPRETYEYDENWNLKRIMFDNKTSIRIETIGNEVFFWQYDERTNDELLIKKQIYSDNKLIESIYYRSNDITGEVHGFHTSFEYYEENDSE